MDDRLDNRLESGLEPRRENGLDTPPTGRGQRQGPLRAQARYIREQLANPPPPPPARRLEGIRREVRKMLEGTDRFDWVEMIWEVEDSRPWTALELKRQVVERDPQSARQILHLADALLVVGRSDEALELCAALHREVPDDWETRDLILDILFATGLDENDFAWRCPPRLVRLGKETRDRIHRWLEAGGTSDLMYLGFELFHGEYPCFDEESLANDLEADGRFEVDRDGGFNFASILDTA